MNIKNRMMLFKEHQIKKYKVGGISDNDTKIKFNSLLGKVNFDNPDLEDKILELITLDRGTQEFKTESLTLPTSTPTLTTDDNEESILSYKASGGVSSSDISSVSSYGDSRGYINNNPLNIRISDNTWLGKTLKNTDGSFELFDNMQLGFRAGLKNMLHLINSGNNTISKLIEKWAPDSDGNNSKKYAMDVASASGIDINAVIDPNNKEQMTKIAHAMARIENGSDADMNDVIGGWNLLS